MRIGSLSDGSGKAAATLASILGWDALRFALVGETLLVTPSSSVRVGASHGMQSKNRGRDVEQMKEGRSLTSEKALEMRDVIAAEQST